MEGTALAEVPAQGSGGELQTAGASARERAEIQGALWSAKQFPRNEDLCFQKLMKAASRASFAEDATYSFPRGDTQVTGPSVNLAREAGRIWGNIRFGLYIVRDDEETRLIRGWAWDVETNTKGEFEDDFKKLIQRKVKGGKPGETVWLIPDERDLRELTNRRGAILVRNALLQVMPKDLIEDALFQCGKTLEQAAGANPEAERKRLMVDFGSINISVEQIEQKIGHPFAQSTPKEIAELRGVCKSIQDGHTTWAEYVKGPEKEKEKDKTQDPNKEALAKGQEALTKMQQGQGDGLDGAVEGKSSTVTRAQASQDAPAPKEPMTCKKACEELGIAQSIKEIASVQIEWDKVESTVEERKKVNDHKDQAMRRLNPNKKK